MPYKLIWVVIDDHLKNQVHENWNTCNELNTKFRSGCAGNVPGDISEKQPALTWTHDDHIRINSGQHKVFYEAQERWIFTSNKTEEKRIQVKDVLLIQPCLKQSNIKVCTHSKNAKIELVISTMAHPTQ